MNTNGSWIGWFLLLPLALLCAGCPQEDRFVVNVQRSFATPEEEALIDIAEHICPLREDVLATAYPEDRDALDVEAGEDCLWWYDTTYIRVPYAITADAIDHFVARVDEIRQVPLVLPFLYPSAALDYHAEIEFQDNYTSGDKQFDNVYLVNMTMSYREMLDPLAGAGFQKQRHVLLTAEGEVLAVFGDGFTAWWVA